MDHHGKHQGVVYSEMASRENTEADLVSARTLTHLIHDCQLDLHVRRMLYPKSSEMNSLLDTYFHECGGLTKDIAVLNNDEVLEYHRRFYRLSNINIVIVGESLDIVKMLERISIEPCYLAATLPMDATSAQESLELVSVHGQKARSTTPCVVEFPSADESIGSIGYGWLGPANFDLESSLVLDILICAMNDTSASPLYQRFVERENPLANCIDFEVKWFLRTSMVCIFSGVPTGKSALTDADGSDDEEVDEEADDGEFDDEEVDEGELNDGKGKNEISIESKTIEIEMCEKTSNLDQKNTSSTTDQSENLFEEGIFRGFLLETLEHLCTTHFHNLALIHATIERYKIKHFEAIETDANGYVTSLLTNNIVRLLHLPPSTQCNIDLACSKIVSTLDSLMTRPISFWQNHFRAYFLHSPLHEVHMKPSSRLADTLDLAVKVEEESRFEELVKNKKVDEVRGLVEDAISACRVNVPAKILSEMPGALFVFFLNIFSDSQRFLLAAVAIFNSRSFT